jgi:hypothetical protein
VPARGPCTQAGMDPLNLHFLVGPASIGEAGHLSAPPGKGSTLPPRLAIPPSCVPHAGAPRSSVTRGAAMQPRQASQIAGATGQSLEKSSRLHPGRGEGSRPLAHPPARAGRVATGPRTPSACHSGHSRQAERKGPHGPLSPCGPPGGALRAGPTAAGPVVI